MPFLQDNPPPSPDADPAVIAEWNKTADAYLGQIGTTVNGNLVLVQIMLEALASAILPPQEWLERQQIAKMNLLTRIMDNAERASLAARLQIAK
jgi:hypothetical protein